MVHTRGRVVTRRRVTIVDGHMAAGTGKSRRADARKVVDTVYTRAPVQTAARRTVHVVGLTIAATETHRA